MLRSTLFSSALLLLLFLATGCNVFDGLEEEGASNDPAVLLQDAELALSRGEAERAERYLRRALDIDPENARVRIKLSTALLAKHRIGALDLMRMARSLRGAEEDAAPASATSALHLTPPAPARLQTVCSFDPTAVDSFEEFQPDEIERFNAFQPSEDALIEIRTLIGRVFDENETTVDDFDGRDVYAVIDSLRSEGFSDAQIAEAAIDDAVATTTLVYLDLSEGARQSYTYYYVDPDAQQDGDRYLGYCADTQMQLEEADEVVGCNEPEVRYTRDLLRARADSLLPANTVAEEVADEAELAYGALYLREDPPTCGGNGMSSLRAAR